MNTSYLLDILYKWAQRLAFGCVCVVLVLGIWGFGCYEAWWFWTVATFLFAAFAFAAFPLALRGVFANHHSFTYEGRLRSGKRLAMLSLGVLPFLIYLLWRCYQPSGVDAATGTLLPLVRMEAERRVLLMVTPVMLVLSLYFIATRQRIQVLGWLILGNAAVVAIYGVANHFITGNNWILWAPSYKYGLRASAPFFCPNHFATYMNIALLLALSMFVVRGASRIFRLLMLPAVLLFLLASFCSVSRGGMISLALTLPFFIVIGLRRYPVRLRLGLTILLLGVFAGGLALLFTTDNLLMSRVKEHPLYRTYVSTPAKDRGAAMKKTFFLYFDRGQYIDCSLRAWRSNPQIGVGPGQHPIRWPQFAATEDGDRATGKWPSRTNHEYFLYEVHSDWMQLLEEFGIVGLVLFCIPIAVILALLLCAQGQGYRESSDGTDKFTPMSKSLPTAAALSIVAVAIHSLGEFSLQLAGITWTLAALVGCGLLSTELTQRTEERKLCKH